MKILRGEGNNSWKRKWARTLILWGNREHTPQSYPPPPPGERELGIYTPSPETMGWGLLRAGMIMPWHFWPASGRQSGLPRFQIKDIDTEIQTRGLKSVVAHRHNKAPEILAGHCQHLLRSFSLKIQRNFCTTLSGLQKKDRKVISFFLVGCAPISVREPAELEEP